MELRDKFVKFNTKYEQLIDRYAIGEVEELESDEVGSGTDGHDESSSNSISTVEPAPVIAVDAPEPTETSVETGTEEITEAKESDDSEDDDSDDEEESEDDDEDSEEEIDEDIDDFWNEYVSDEDYELMELDEAIKRIRVIRHGKPVWKLKSTKKGYKIYHGKEVPLTKDEQKRRSQAAARVGKRKSTIKKRKKTLGSSLRTRKKLKSIKTTKNRGAEK